MLRVNDIDVYYGKVQALRKVSLEVNEGELVALIGSNGAGKTTLLMTLSGLQKPTSGTIEFLETRVDKLPAHKIIGLGIAQVPQGGYLWPKMTVLENLELGVAQATRATAKEMLEKVYSYFEMLAERRKQNAGTLSGGERQMLAIGRALMSAPKLILLDEPSVGLSPIVVQNLADILVNLHGEGLTMLLVEQNARLALDIADRGYVLQTGSVIASGKASDLLENELVRKAYLGM